MVPGMVTDRLSRQQRLGWLGARTLHVDRYATTDRAWARALGRLGASALDEGARG
jgi:hypothetical protein